MDPDAIMRNILTLTNQLIFHPMLDELQKDSLERIKIKVFWKTMNEISSGAEKNDNFFKFSFEGIFKNYQQTKKRTKNYHGFLSILR